MKVYLDMVGCRLNQSELENYARQFRLAGHTLTSDAKSADIIVINTCTVTSAAASDSRQKINHAAQTHGGQVIVTGCWADLNVKEALAIHGVSQVIGNREKDDLVPLVLNLPPHELAHQRFLREPIPGSRLRTRAFIKVQDGCDNHCTYCITRLARGAGRSRPVSDVLEDIQSALEGSAQEIVLTGVHLGSWGYDFDPPQHLSTLVDKILAETDVPRLRLSSLEPWDIGQEFFALWENSRICRHLHLPLQSGCEATLKRMGRRITPHAFAELVQQARRWVPGLAITTDIITGFPGETEAEFSESAGFVAGMAFTGGHVFTYSPRPGTSAAHLPEQVPYRVAKQRNAAMREIFQRSKTAFLEKQVGQKLPVLWEKASLLKDEQWELSGLSDTYLRVIAKSPLPCRNQVMEVIIVASTQDELVGVIAQA